MSMNWKELAGKASSPQREQFAPGIAKAQKYLDGLAAKGEVPERFTPDKPRLHPSLEGKARVETLTIGGRPKDIQLKDLEERGVQIGGYARSMMEDPAYLTSDAPHEVEIVSVQVRDMGIKKDYPTTTDIEKWRTEMGLEKVPAELAPEYRLTHMDQPKGKWDVMYMDPIAGSGGYPRVFGVVHDDGGLWLSSRWVRPDYGWDPGRRCVFSFSK